MNHLTESQINEILDNTLRAPDQGAIHKHLSECAECRNKVEALRRLFQALVDVPEENLPHDLAPKVLSLLPEPKIRLGWKLVLAGQAGFAVGITILIVTNLLSFVNLPKILTAFPLRLAPIQLPVIHYHLPTLNIQTSTANLIFLAVSALILWGVGNATLLRGNKATRK